KGSEVGLLAVGATLVLSLVAGAQWLDRPEDLSPHLDTRAEETHGADEGHGDDADSHTEEEGEGDHALAGEIVLAATEAGGDHGEGGEGEDAEEHHPVREAVDNSVTWFEI